MSQAHTLAQVSSSVIPSPAVPPTLFEGSLAAALIIYFVKEGINFFKQKDAEESKLTSDLIQDLRRERSEQLQQMIQIVQRLNQSHQQLSSAIQQNTIVLSGVSQALQQQDRVNVQIQQSLREVQQQNVLLSAKIDRITVTSSSATHELKPS